MSSDPPGANESQVLNSHPVIIVGGGLAGLTTANRLAELHIPSVILERGQDQRYPCNSRFTGGAYHVAFRDIADGPEQLLAAILDLVHPHGKHPLAKALADDAGRGVRWLQAQGIRFVKGPETYQRWLFAPPRANRAGLHWAWRSGDTTLRTLESNFTASGGTLLRGAQARYLLTDGERCTGVQVQIGQREETFRCEAVVLADGGFQGSTQYLAEFVTDAPTQLFQRGAGSGIGSGLSMARTLGANLVGCEAFYGHLLAREAFTNRALWPWPTLDNLANHGLLLDDEGRRFTDEGRGGVAMANALARTRSPREGWIVFDDAIWRGPGRDKFIPANPYLEIAGATMIQADSIEALAARCKLRPDRLRVLVDHYNAAILSGNGDTLQPPRTGPARPLSAPPFYAVQGCPGITYTMGGVEIDEFSAVLNRRGKPIPGLWAAGSTTGGLEGGPDAAYVGGLSRATVTGLRAAEGIARTRARLASGLN